VTVALVIDGVPQVEHGGWLVKSSGTAPLTQPGGASRTGASRRDPSPESPSALGASDPLVGAWPRVKPHAVTNNNTARALTDPRSRDDLARATGIIVRS
jgi:hypothetical protein